MSKNIAIDIEGLGKRYKLGETVDLARNFRETLMGLPGYFKRRAAHATKQLARSIVSGGEALPADTPKDTFWAVRDVNLRIEEGEVIGIIGRNGAGKSTLLKILSRITPPSAGRAIINGRMSSLLEVGTGFHPELTGRENIFLNGAILGMRKAEIVRKFDEIVAFAETEKFLDTPVKRYSSGMRVRLAFAVAAHLEPEILVIDEVLSVGDQQFQRKCLGKLDDVSRGGRTVLFVSHSMSAVERLCTRCVLMRNGQVAMDGAPPEIIKQYVAEGQAMPADVTLTPPDTARVGFRRIWISDCNGDPSGELDVMEPFRVNMIAEVRKRTTDVDISFGFVNGRETPVTFASLSDTNGGQIMPLEPGLHEFHIDIRGHFLVPDVYKLNVSAHVPSVRHEDNRPGLISFSLMETRSALSKYRDPSALACVFNDFQWAHSASAPTEAEVD